MKKEVISPLLMTYLTNYSLIFYPNAFHKHNNTILSLHTLVIR